MLVIAAVVRTGYVQRETYPCLIQDLWTKVGMF
jgi:hypothetical protein